MNKKKWIKTIKIYAKYANNNCLWLTEIFVLFAVKIAAVKKRNKNPLNKKN